MTVDYKQIGGFSLRCSVEVDEAVSALANAFDFSYEGESVVEIPSFSIPQSYGIGLIVGPSGSGKTSLLKQLGSVYSEEAWPKDKAICSVVETEKLTGLGLSDIRDLVKPYHVLSTGQQHRASLSRSLSSGLCFDELTSVVHRELAKSICMGIRRRVKREGLTQVHFSTCHRDVVPYLDPCWVIDLKDNTVSLRPESGWEKEERTISIERGSASDWPIFSKFHYLDAGINKAGKVWVMRVDGELVGFCSVLALPNGYMTNAVRSHRLVILPDYQGRGYGPLLSDYVADLFYKEGKKFYEKTAHPSLHRYRLNSPRWMRVRKGKRTDQKSKGRQSKEWRTYKERVTESFEYIGPDEVRIPPLKKKEEQLPLL